MVNWANISLPILNWQIRKKRTQLQKTLSPYIAKITDIDRTTLKKITGTFIYAKPPDYEGLRTIDWSKADWMKEFLRLKAMGIEIAILQSTVVEDTEKNWYICYPISETTIQKIITINQRIGNLPIMKTHVLPAILDAAQETNMKIHLGLFGSITGWYTISSPHLVKEIQAEQIAIAKDLLAQYSNHPALAGWYISPEIMYFLHGKTLKLNMNDFLKGITSVIKSKTPTLPIGISPGSTLPKGNPEPVIQFWKNTLINSGIDLLYPQDAVGQLVYFPDKVEKLWIFWNKIANETKLKLWANCENFERASFNLPNPFISTSFPRLHWQLAAASPYVERILCWECLFFLNSKGAVDGEKLEKEYHQYFFN